MSDNNDSWSSLEDDDCSAEVTSAKCLYIGSNHYNPVLALGCKETPVPALTPEKYHSIEEFAMLVPNIEAEGTPPPKFRVSQKLRKVVARLTQSHPPEPGSSSKPSVSIPSNTLAVQDPLHPIPGRRFLAHQLPVQLPLKAKPNVITLMDDCQGPLAALNQARLKFTRIRIWRRDPHGIRGYCTGFVVGFDKHWNVILKDVDEVYQRQRQRGRSSSTEAITGSGGVQEKSDFKSGQLLSEYQELEAVGRHRDTPTQKVVRKGTPTGYLIHGHEDAIEVCRVGIRSLLQQGLDRDKSTDTKGANTVTKSTLRKKQLVILRQAQEDFLGNKVVARSQLYEIVQRHCAQVVIMGRSIAFVETSL